jgi:hypothetical protein
MATDQKSGEFSGTANAVGKGKKLLERAWEALWAAGFEESAARRYLAWMLDYIVFHGTRHPQEMGVPEVQAFLASERFLGQAAQRVEATAALRFLYEVVLQRRWPRGVLDGTAENTAHGSGGKPKPVYLNGRQPGVKRLDRVRNALREGQYARETEKIPVFYRSYRRLAMSRVRWSPSVTGQPWGLPSARVRLSNTGRCRVELPSIKERSRDEIRPRPVACLGHRPGCGIRAGGR